MLNFSGAPDFGHSDFSPEFSGFMHVHKQEDYDEEATR